LSDVFNVTIILWRDKENLSDERKTDVKPWVFKSYNLTLKQYLQIMYYKRGEGRYIVIIK
jgi:hypothetical protein